MIAGDLAILGGLLVVALAIYGAACRLRSPRSRKRPARQRPAASLFWPDVRIYPAKRWRDQEGRGA